VQWPDEIRELILVNVEVHKQNTTAMYRLVTGEAAASRIACDVISGGAGFERRKGTGYVAGYAACQQFLQVILRSLLKRLKGHGAEERSSPSQNARTVSPTGLRSPPSTSFPNHH